MSGEAGGDPLRRAAERRPGAPAADGPDADWSYRRLDREASALALRLRRRLPSGRERDRDPEAGKRGRPKVAAFLPRVPAGLAAVHGVPRAGAVLAPLQDGWTGRELARYLRRLEPDLVIGPPGALARAAEADPETPRLELRPGQGRTDPDDLADVSDVATARASGDHSLVATSGSTGTPRPVRLTWENHLASARGAAERLDLRPGDRWFASLSLAHVGGLALAVRAAAVGSSVVLRGDFDAGTLDGLVSEGRVTHASLVPVMLRRLLDVRDGHPLPDTTRALLVGGAGTPSGLLERALDAGVPAALTYGLTEACSQVATAPPELVRRKPGSVGPPLPGVQVRTGEGGEILVRGPTVSPGYLDGEPATSDEGWLRTGDAGRVDEEGHLRVTGRLSERIVTGGTTVHPAEVEEALRDHPGVREAVALGIPSEEWGEVVGAAVVTAVDGPDREQLERHCRQRLSTPRRPRRWALLDQLPRLPSGKPDREGLRRVLREDEGRPEIDRPG